MDQKIQYYDNLRAFACFLVILSHSARPALDPSFGVFMVFFSLISSPSSELFVSISSSLLAPCKVSMFEFYKKRFSKLLWPFLFWSVIMVCYRFLTQQISLEVALERIVLFPIRETEGPYWFVYIICGLYLINPIISPWLINAKKKEFHIVLGIWLITLILPYLNFFAEKEIYDIQGNYYFIFNYMGGFIGYMLLGVYLRKYPIYFRTKFLAFIFVIILVAVGTIPVIWSYIYSRSMTDIVMNNLSLTSALYVTAIYVYFKNFKFSQIVEKSMSLIAKYSFGIYLIHILVVREIVGKTIEMFRFPHPVLETPFIAITSLIICVSFTTLLSYLPKSKYIIGV